MKRFSLLVLSLCGSLLAGSTCAAGPREFDVRAFGAKGDGVAVDSPAINAAIEAADAAGGGVVRLPAGRYLCFSIRLKSRLVLRLEEGAVIVAGDPASGLGRYDEAEPNAWDAYQDFGHSHWHNSLIWGDGIEGVTIEGPGLIDGAEGLSRMGPPPKQKAENSDGLRSPGGGMPPSGGPPPGGGGPSGAPPQFRVVEGAGNKAIALKDCRNVTLRGFSVLRAGHFALLATGVDHLDLIDLTIDTNRDGFDIDACRDVRVENCTVNSPNDDAIVLKSSFALGEARATENVVITRCRVSGFDIGTVLDGTRQQTTERAPDRDGPTGRIKFGTESNGGFRNITITDCVFERSRGLALETVDGGTIENVTVRNLTMRDIANAPIFLRLGNRARGPEGTPVGAIRRVDIRNVTVDGADARYAGILVAGLPGHTIQDVTLADIRIASRGGLTPEIVAQQPAELINPFFLRGEEPGLTGPRDLLAVPEREKGYPEPSMFGLLPASAVYARHVEGLVVRNVEVTFAQADTRPLVVLDDAAAVTLDAFQAPKPENGPAFVLRQVRGFELKNSPAFPGTHPASAEEASF